MTKVCVVGSGGREATLAGVLGRSAEVVVTPGTPGIAGSTKTPPAQIDADLYVIGPEVPLVAGLADELRAAGKRVFGPRADGAMLEASKEWMKDVLLDASVPTAAHAAFGADELEAAMAFMRTLPGLYVIKTDGLAAGKGVLVTESFEEASEDVRAKLAGESFGDAGKRVVIEEGLTGPELSLFAVCDGQDATVLRSPAQDHKRLGDGDTGLNTGGMGAFTPVPSVDDDLIDEMSASAIEPTLAMLAKRGIDYRGVLYGGFMLTPEGPKVLEYNVRFGDPEAQVLLPRLSCDLVDLLGQAADGAIRTEPTFADDSFVTVVCASAGYPEQTRTGDRIDGISEARGHQCVDVLTAGVCVNDDGELVTAGGRVLNVVGQGENLDTARQRAYAAVAEISWPGMHYRRDIGVA